MTDISIVQIGEAHHLIYEGRSVAIITDLPAVECIVDRAREAMKPKKGRPPLARTLPKPGTRTREVFDQFLDGPRMRGDLDAAAIATLRRGGLLHAIDRPQQHEGKGGPPAVYGLTPLAVELYRLEES